MAKSITRIIASLGTAYAIVQASEWLLVKFGVNALTAQSVIGGSLVLGACVWFVQGYWLDGFLMNSVELTMKGIGASITIMRGDVFDQRGLVVVQVNDFFDTVVDDIHIAQSSLHGQLIQRFWSGNVYDLDRQIEDGLRDVSYETVVRDGVAKERRYPIGTTVLVADREGRRFLLVALTHTNPQTHETTANYFDLIKAVNSALVSARRFSNGASVFLTVMGGGSAKISMPPFVLFNTLISGIVSESKRKVSDRVCVVLKGKSSRALNLAAIKEQWAL